TRGLTPTLLLGLREGGAELRAARREAGDQRGVVRRQLLDRGLRGAREPARQLLPRGCALAGVAFLRRGRAGGGAGVRRGHGREQDETKDDVGRPIDFRGCHATPPDWSLPAAEAIGTVAQPRPVCPPKKCPPDRRRM